jgi:hypothetical protein
MAIDIMPLGTALTPDGQGPMTRIVPRPFDVRVFGVGVWLWQAQAAVQCEYVEHAELTSYSQSHP